MKEELSWTPVYPKSYFAQKYHNSLDEIPIILPFDDNADNDALWTTSTNRTAIYKMPSEQVNETCVKQTLHAYPISIEDKETWNKYFDGLWPKKDKDGGSPFIETYYYNPAPRNRIAIGCYDENDIDAENAIRKMFRDTANKLLNRVEKMSFKTDEEQADN